MYILHNHVHVYARMYVIRKSAYACYYPDQARKEVLLVAAYVYMYVGMYVGIATR